MVKAFGTGARLGALGVATAAVLTFSVPAFAVEKAPTPGAAPAADLQLQKAPVTAPSPALIAGIQAMIKRDPAEKPGVQEWPDGTLALTLGGSFLNVLVAQGQPDGTFHTFCVTAPEAVKTLSIATPAAAPAYEEK
jgi:hypothetical protein